MPVSVLEDAPAVIPAVIPAGGKGRALLVPCEREGWCLDVWGLCQNSDLTSVTEV